MSRQLWITVRFLTTRYHGEEWPPSPARLFQALVAGATAGCQLLKWPLVRNSLLWLEKLKPPEIVSNHIVRAYPYKAFVPTNDSDAPKIVARLANGVPLPDAMRREAMLTPKKYYPKVFHNSDEAIMHYIWRFSERDTYLASQVCMMARNLLALGWGIDVVAGDGCIHPHDQKLPEGNHYLPSSHSCTILLKCPTSGFLEDIERCYQAFRKRMSGPAVDTDTHIRSYYPVGYKSVDGSIDRMFVAFDFRDAKGGWKGFRWQDGMLVSAWLRHAARRRFQIEEWDDSSIDTYVSGHTIKGNENYRLSYVPLPSVGHKYSDGRHRRAFIVLPFGDKGAAMSAINRMAGDELISTNGESMAWLALSQSDGVIGRYVAESSRWLSVSPVILHGYDCDSGRFRPRKSEKLILQAFDESGYDIGSIEEFSFQPAPFWRSLGSAFQAQAPKHLSRWPRYHVRVVFKNPVKGPLLIGIGRHYGLGLFAAAE